MDKIRLPRDGAEYAQFTFAPLPLPSGVTLEAQIGGAWYALDVSGALPKLLLRGPNTPNGTPGVLVSADGPIRVRVKNAPEIIVRGAGYVALVS